MTVVEIYLRITPRQGATFISQHWAWDAERFVAASQESHKKDATVEKTTRAEYRAANWRKP